MWLAMSSDARLTMQYRRADRLCFLLPRLLLHRLTDNRRAAPLPMVHSVPAARSQAGHLGVAPAMEMDPLPLDYRRTARVLAMRAETWLQRAAWRVSRLDLQLLTQISLAHCLLLVRDLVSALIVPRSRQVPTWRASRLDLQLIKPISEQLPASRVKPLVLQWIVEICLLRPHWQADLTALPLRMQELQERELSMDSLQGSPLTGHRLLAVGLWRVSLLAFLMPMFRRPTWRSWPGIRSVSRMFSGAWQALLDWQDGPLAMAPALQMALRSATSLDAVGQAARRAVDSPERAAWRAGHLAHRMNMLICQQSHRMLSMEFLTAHRSHSLLYLRTADSRVNR